MKKIAVLLVFALYLHTSLSAQDFRFGFQLSPTFSWISTDDSRINGNGSNLGLKLGMMGEKYFGNADNYALKFGIGFAFNQGGTLKHDMGGVFWSNSDPMPINYPLGDGVNLKYNLQYVEIPFGLKLRSDEFSHIRYYGEFPIITLGFRTQASGDISSDPVMGNNIENININDDVNFFNISWGIGAGIEYGVGDRTALVAGIYYQNGFIDVTKDKDAVKSNGDSEDSKGTLQGITLRLGVMF